MQLYKRIIFFLILFIGVGIIAYSLGKKANDPSVVTPKQEEGTFTCPYKISGGLYKDYVRSANEVAIVGKPQFIEKPKIIKLEKPFNKLEFEKGLYKLSTDTGWESRKFDVDGDNSDETIINANVAMNHTPHIAMIVKAQNIIFEANGANIWIEEVYGGQGFILNETVDWNIGETKTIRYI